MMSPSRTAIVRPALFAVALLASLLGLALPAAAQGRCSCNSGCHQYPGQCVQRGGAGCDPGFAPFCGTRASSCPNTGWVSCSGDCACVRVPGGDGGVADAVTSDLGVVVDAALPPQDARPADAQPAADGPMMSLDAPSPDVVAPSPDVVASDRAVASDAPPASGDAPPATDAGCVCPGGVCIDGACVTERCGYFPELGFLCAGVGTRCRLIAEEAYCVPVCAGVRCAAGEFCDERTAGQCVLDDCATRTCPAGTTCHHNQCGNHDGGVRGDAATASGDGGAMTAEDGGCGCRAPGPGRAGSAAWWGVAALLCAIRRRKR